jgi:signal transduction histidine kinase/predicted transcriptional regulator
MRTLASIAHVNNFAIDSNVTITEAIKCMLSNGNGMAVLLQEKKPVGIVTKSLLLAKIDLINFNEKVNTVAKTHIISVLKSRPVESAFNLVVTNNIRRLVLVDKQGNYSGVVLQEDLFDFLEEDVYKVDLKVADLLSADSHIIAIRKDATLHDALLLMQRSSIGSVLITDKNENAIGIVTEKDILAAGYKHTDMRQNITKVMSSPVLSVGEEYPLTQVIKLMKTHSIRRVVITDQEKKARAVLTNRDIFQHIKGNVARMLEIKLRHAKEIMDLLPEAIIEIFDVPNQQAIQWMNKRAKTLFGSHLLDQHPAKLMDEQTWELLYNQLKEKHIVQTFLVNIQGKSYEFSGTLSQNINSRYIKLVAKDITEHESIKQILKEEIKEEVRLRRENEHLMMQQARMASIGETVSYIAHQWRQPLGHLGGILMNLESAYSFGELNKEYLKDKIDQGNTLIKYMSQTIDDFRLFFQPNKKQEAFDIIASIEQSLKIVSASLNYNHIRIKKEYEQIPFYLLGYPSEFAQAVLNLINNARDALLQTQQEDKIITISISQHEKQIKILLCDNGSGIDEEILAHIFDPYKTSKQDQGGTGIGLYITRLIIEQKMHGKIKAYNTSSGACFSITLPQIL